MRVSLMILIKKLSSQPFSTYIESTKRNSDLSKPLILANSATQESDDSHTDFICISQSLKRFNLLR
jgi:hypothetical protein